MAVKQVKAKDLKDNEMSKRIFWAVFRGFALHVLLSMGLILLDYGDDAIELLKATAGIYMAVVAGYFGKAGVENYQKIRVLTQDLYTEEKSNG